MGRTKETIDEKKLRSWKLLDDFRSRLAKVRASMPPPPYKRPGGPERLLLEENYFSLVLFGLFNPVIKTMRGLCAASHLKRVKEGEVIVGDRYYGLEYSYFGELKKRGASCVIRIRNKPRMETVEELPLTAADLAAGITWQGRVKLGEKWQGDPIRVVRVEVDGKTLLLATDLEMEAELIALIYRYRWQVELFFKWLKSILGCRHLMAESPDGVAIQIYSALIAALMLQLLTGKRPGKRAMELIQLYLMGYAELEEVITLLAPKKAKA